MKICHIVSHIDEEASGPSYSVPSLCASLSQVGAEVTLLTLDRGGRQKVFESFQHLSFAQSKFPKKLGRSPAMHGWLKSVTREGVKVLHSHGLWMMPNIYPAWASNRLGIPHVIAPRGTLDPAALRYSAFTKTVFWTTAQNWALRKASAFHATSEAEAEHIRAQGFRQPIFLSHNGVDIPDLAPRTNSKRRTLLYLGRLHPKKGLDLLLNAWSQLENTYDSWDLHIFGKGPDWYERELGSQIDRLKLSRAFLHGPVFGQEKQKKFQQAEVFVLPSRGENFGMVVAESLAAGTPVIATDVTPWNKLEYHQAGWVCHPSTNKLKAALEKAMGQSSSELRSSGENGRLWMRQEFSWLKQAEYLKDAYKWLLNGGAKPDCVMVD